MDKYNDSCYINSMYTLLQFLLLRNKKEREKTFYFFGRGIPENVAEHFKNSWHLNIRFKDEKGLNRYIKMYSLYKKLEKFIIKENLINKIIYMQDNMSYSQFFLNHMEECYLLEDGFSNYKVTISKKKMKKGIKKIRDKFLKRYKYEYPTFGLSEKIKKIYLTGIMEIPEIIKNKVEIINLREKWKNLSNEEKQEILDIFILKLEDFNNLEKYTDKVLIITQPLSEDKIISEEEKISIYKEIIDKYSYGNVIIKIHPREKTDYKKIYSDIEIINGKFPLELLMLLGIYFKTVVTIFSTAALNFKGMSNVHFIGTENYPKLLEKCARAKEEYFEVKK